MRKKFLVNLGFLSVLNFLVKPFYILFIDRAVQNAVGSEEYGLYFATFNFAFLFHIVLDFGISSFNNINVAKDTRALEKYLPGLLLMKLLLAVVYLAVTFIIAFWIGFSEYHLSILFFMALGQVFISFTQFFRSGLAGLHLFKADALLSVLDKMLLSLVVGGLLLSTVQEPFEIEWFVYSQAFVFFLTAGAGLVMILAQTGRWSRELDFPFMTHILKSAYPFALLGILMSVYNRIDSIMLERLLPDGNTEAGIYAASFRLLDGVNMIGFLFATLLMPMFARMLQNKHEIAGLLNMSFRMMFTITIITSFLCLFYRDEIMFLLYPEATDYWGNIFGLLLLSFICTGSIYIFGTLLTAAERLKHLNMMALAGVAMNVGLNFLLIYEYKALGATAATLFTQFIVAGLHIIVARKVFKLKTDWTLILQTILLTAMTAGTIYGTTFLPIHWIYKVFTGGLLSLCAAILIRYIDLSKFRSQVVSS